ncbi:hypothetical protein [Streptomyces sp. NPDC055287]
MPPASHARPAPHIGTRAWDFRRTARDFEREAPGVERFRPVRGPDRRAATSVPCGAVRPRPVLAATQ